MEDRAPIICQPDEHAGGTGECVEIHNSKERGRITLFRKPATPDPFVNAQMTSIGPDDDGRERFFISCLSGEAGATSFLTTEDGQFTTFPWRDFTCVYGVTAQSADCLWLAGYRTDAPARRRALDFVRLSLSSGQWQTYPVAAGRWITPGMALDHATGKLFCGTQTALVCFDTRTRKTVRVYEEAEKPPDNFHHDHWRMPDGSYGFIFETPGLSFLRWDPKGEQVQWQRLTADNHHPAIGLMRWLKYVEQGRLYLPYFGWLDGITGEITPHDHPPNQEACWLGRRGRKVIGVQSDSINACAKIITWDLDDGSTTPLLTMPDTRHSGCALTGGGKLVSVDLYGTFRRHDLATGALELTRHFRTENEHRCNAILPVGKDRVVGTPFIAMNFWDYDTREGKGSHAGRVAGSLGQCDYAVEVGGKIYFAIYGGGQLTEYDPSRPAGFPRNPHLVAQNSQGQHGAGITTDGRVVWAAFRPKYGTLDGAMIRFDTLTGEAGYRNAALRAQHIVSPVFDPATGCLVAGTSYLSDCSTAKPVHDRAFAVVLDPCTMDVIRSAECPPGAHTLVNHGPIDAHRWLMQGGDQLLVFDTQAASLSPHAQRSTVPDGTVRLAYSGMLGRFVIQVGERLQTWDADTNAFTPLATLADGFAGRWWVHGTHVTLDCGRYAVLWRNCLSPGTRPQA
ncbi:MAG: hypothetical protein HN742_22685 [Lentisphaerae bacterium]|jgi:hypothetical protein|nr:hypothetical protein [Lentisphaerota bacterium]MBT5612497.1 hypothetical protein [Lentisphaerota bacterium]MBT7844702.1 hypothetical protein [Lentisphaerota bacterium]